MLVTDVEAIVKASRDQVLVFAQDPKTGKARAGASVMAADNSGIILTGKTGPDGVLLAGWPRPRSQRSQVEYLVQDGPHVAATGLTLPDTVAQGIMPRALIYTDRPAYRPGNRVGLRGIVREVRDGQFAADAGTSYRFEVFDSRGRRIVGRSVATSPFGTFHAELPLDTAAAVGTYRIHVYPSRRQRVRRLVRGPGVPPGEGRAVRRAAADRLLPRRDDLGPRVRPLSRRNARWPAGRSTSRSPTAGPSAARPTPRAGSLSRCRPRAFAEARSLRIVARLTEDEVEASAVAALAVRRVLDRARARRGRSTSAGEPFPLRAVTRDATGRPIGRTLFVAVVKQVAERPSFVNQDSGSEPASTVPAQSPSARSRVCP